MKQFIKENKDYLIFELLTVLVSIVPAMFVYNHFVSLVDALIMFFNCTTIINFSCCIILGIIGIKELNRKYTDEQLLQWVKEEEYSK